MTQATPVYAGPPFDPPGEPDLVVVGAASRDLAADDPRGWRLGGAAAYCSLTAARLGLHVRCLLGVDGAAASADELGMLTDAGVELRLVPLNRGPVFQNVEVAGSRRQRWFSKSDAVAPSALPVEWRGAAAWLLVPVAGEIGEEWAAELAAISGARVGLGWQGLLREFGPDGWVHNTEPRPSPLLSMAGLVCASRHDLEPLMTLGQLRPLAPLAAIVLTSGSAGGVVFRGTDEARYQSLLSSAEVDPTGAGDVFLAALMVAWLATGEPATADALRFAAAAGSCAIERVGLAGVPTREEVAVRLGEAAARPRARPTGASPAESGA